MGNSNNDDIKIDGKKEAALLLAGLDEANRERILLGIAEQNPELAVYLRKNLYDFQQVLRLAPVEFQIVLQGHPIRFFALALRGLEPDELKKVFSKLSERQARALQEEIDSLGPSKLSDVKNAREKITQYAKDLHENGQIHLK